MSFTGDSLKGTRVESRLDRLPESLIIDCHYYFHGEPWEIATLTPVLLVNLSVSTLGLSLNYADKHPCKMQFHLLPTPAASPTSSTLPSEACRGSYQVLPFLLGIPYGS